MWTRIQTLEGRLETAHIEHSFAATAIPKNKEESEAGSAGEERENRHTGDDDEEEDGGTEGLCEETKKKQRGKAALVIQTNWRQHRNKVMQCSRVPT